MYDMIKIILIFSCNNWVCFFVTEILYYFNVNANNIMIPIPCLITQYDNTCHKLGDEDTLPSL